MSGQLARDPGAARDLEDIFTDLLKTGAAATGDPRVIARQLIELLGDRGYLISRADPSEVLTIECNDDPEGDELFGRPMSDAEFEGAQRLDLLMRFEPASKA